MNVVMGLRSNMRTPVTEATLGRDDETSSSGERGRLPAGFFTRRMAGIAVSIGLLALLLSIFHLGLLTLLPAYPAVALGFLLIIVLPGLIMQGAVLSSWNSDAGVRVAVAPALGLAIGAVTGAFALGFHLELQQFATLYAVVASLVCGVSVVYYDSGAKESAESAPEGATGTVLLLGLLAVAFGGILTTPFWAGSTLAADFDAWNYLAYIREFIDTTQLNAEEPFLGTGDAVNPRMRTNVWVLLQALIADVTDVPPQDAVLIYMRPLLTVFATLATYAATRTLFKNQTMALLAAAFFLGYALLDIAPHEGFGRHLFSRVSEDKVAGAFLLFPIGLLFFTRFAGARSFASLAGFALVVLALSMVHPVPLVFLAITVGSYGALRVFLERSLAPVRITLLFLTPIVIASIWPLVQRELLIDAVPEVFDTGQGAILYRAEFRVVWLGFGLTMGNYHMIFHPVMLAAIAMAPVVWFASRRSVGNQIAVAMTAGALLVFLFPLLSTPLAKIMAPQTLWRIAWMIPVAPILGYVTYLLATQAARAGPFGWLAKGGIGHRLVAGVAPAVILVLVLGAALLVQEPYLIADDGSYYDWQSESQVIPGMEQSIFRGGLDRLFSGTWRLEPYEKELFRFLDENTPEGSVVLMEPARLGYLVPGMLTHIYPVDPGTKLASGPRRDDSRAFARGELTVAALEDVINRHEISYIVVREVARANASVQALDRATFIAEISPYLVYRVDQ